MRWVVCGAASAGKSTWVQERAKPGDLVWDLDAVASVVAYKGVEIPREKRGQLPTPVVKALMAMRAALVDWLAVNALRGVDVYVIVTRRARAERIAELIGADLVDLGEEPACVRAGRTYSLEDIVSGAAR